MTPFKLHIPAYVSSMGVSWSKDWQKRGEEWIEKMLGYYEKGGRHRDMSIERINKLLNGGCWDWDDNVAESWAKQLAEHLRIHK